MAAGTIFKWAQYEAPASDSTSIPAVGKDTLYSALSLDIARSAAPLSQRLWAGRKLCVPDKAAAPITWAARRNSTMAKRTVSTECPHASSSASCPKDF